MKLQPLRIITGWAMIWNSFREVDPSEENKGSATNVHLHTYPIVPVALDCNGKKNI